jgi:hypothetical protein
MKLSDYYQTCTLSTYSPDNQPVARRWDYSSPGYIYEGMAAPGTLTSQPLWSIRRMDAPANTAPTSITWANGSALCNCVWDNRLTYTYS